MEMIKWNRNVFPVDMMVQQGKKDSVNPVKWEKSKMNITFG